MTTAKPPIPRFEERRVADVGPPPGIEDRRAAHKGPPPGIKDRRVASKARRNASRTKTLKGAEIVLPVGANITCIVRNISTSGAQLEVHRPIPYNTFDLVFDDDEWSRRSCAVVWRRETTIGVKFQ